MSTHRGNVTYDFIHGGSMPSDAFVVAEPALAVELNIIRWLRLDGGGSYRFISGLALPDVRNTHLRGFSGTLALSFGRF